VTLILWVAVGRIRIYNYPSLRQIMPDGTTRPVKSDHKDTDSLRENIKALTAAKGCGPIAFMVIFTLFMLLGTVAAILSTE